MTTITVWIGLNVESLKFSTGGGPCGLNGSTVICGVNETYRHMIETHLHPLKIQQKVIQEIEYCKDAFDLNITTHSDNVIHTIAFLINNGKLNHKSVNIHLLNDTNDQIIQTSTFSEDGVLENWTYGYFDIPFDI